MKRKIILAGLLSAFILSAAGCADNSQSTISNLSETEISSESSVENSDNSQNNLMVIKEEGYFSAGGTVRTNSGEYVKGNQYLSKDGQTVHGDHATVAYQIPENEKKYPMVFLHGVGQSSRCWSTTPDGREGFQQMFLKDGYGIYLVDQPRRGLSGQSTEDASVASDSSDQMWFSQFRIGEWPDFYDGVQFPKDDESIDQFFRQMTPDVGMAGIDMISDAMSAIFDKTGPAIFFTHSAGGVMGWETAIKNDNVKGIVAIEPGMFVFPEGEVPDKIPNLYEQVAGVVTDPLVVSKEDFDKLTKMPIIIYYGDYIPAEPSENAGMDYWRATMEYGKLFVDCVNKHGGDAKLVFLPDEGIKGNTHFVMSDLNNDVIKEHISKWLSEKNLDE